MITRARTLFLLFVVSHCSAACTPAKAPTARDLAATAVVVVDQALADYIELSTADAAADQQFQKCVDTVKKAADVVKAAGDFCEVLPELQLVATTIKCDKCSAPLAAAKEQLKCLP